MTKLPRTSPTRTTDYQAGQTPIFFGGCPSGLSSSSRNAEVVAVSLSQSYRLVYILAREPQTLISTVGASLQLVPIALSRVGVPSLCQSLCFVAATSRTMLTTTALVSTRISPGSAASCGLSQISMIPVRVRGTTRRWGSLTPGQSPAIAQILDLSAPSP